MMSIINRGGSRKRRFRGNSLHATDLSIPPESIKNFLRWHSTSPRAYSTTESAALKNSLQIHFSEPSISSLIVKHKHYLTCEVFNSHAVL